MGDKPVMRELYDRLADQLGPQLTELTASDRFAEVAETADAVRVRASSGLQRSSRRLLHAWNLPAGTDVTVLRQEIGSLERSVRTLTRQVESLHRRLDEVDGRIAPDGAAATEQHTTEQQTTTKKKQQKKTATSAERSSKSKRSKQG